jgi:epsilon-lactone hydrolase
MASWQAYVAVWVVKWRVKRKLRAVRDHHESRKILRPEPIAVPENVRITPADVGGVSGEWVEADQPNATAAADGRGDPLPHSKPLLLYLHGGGYFACSAKTHRAITVFFAQQRFRVYAPNYRLAPENPFPAAVDDAVAVYRGLLAAGYEPHNMVVSGESAGGGLTLSLLLTLRQKGIPLPAGAAIFSPWTDLAATGESIAKNSERCAMFVGANIAPSARLYLGNTDPRDPIASPLYADLHGLPPLLIHVAADEVLLDDSTRLAERARAAGVRVELKIWPVVPHAWQLATTKIPEARASLRESGEFLQALLKEHGSPAARVHRA